MSFLLSSNQLVYWHIVLFVPAYKNNSGNLNLTNPKKATLQTPKSQSGLHHIDINNELSSDNEVIRVWPDYPAEIRNLIAYIFQSWSRGGTAPQIYYHIFFFS